MSGIYAENRSGFTRLLRDLLDNDVLEHPTTRAIASLVLEGGLSSLAPDQRDIYELYIKPHLNGGHSNEDHDSFTI
jgi:hypothetical protein